MPSNRFRAADSGSAAAPTPSLGSIGFPSRFLSRNRSGPSARSMQLTLCSAHYACRPTIFLRRICIYSGIIIINTPLATFLKLAYIHQSDHICIRWPPYFPAGHLAAALMALCSIHASDLYLWLLARFPRLSPPWETIHFPQYTPSRPPLRKQAFLTRGQALPAEGKCGRQSGRTAALVEPEPHRRATAKTKTWRDQTSQEVRALYPFQTVLRAAAAPQLRQGASEPDILAHCPRRHHYCRAM